MMDRRMFIRNNKLKPPPNKPATLITVSSSEVKMMNKDGVCAINALIMELQANQFKIQGAETQEKHRQQLTLCQRQ
jgi:hypothetical protein